MLSRWIATIVVTAAALVPGVGRGEVAGKWVAELTSPTLLEPAYIRVVLGQTGDAVSGTWGTEIVKGTVKGSTVSLALTDAAGRDAGTLTGKIEGDAGGGGGTMAGVGGRGGRGGTPTVDPAIIPKDFPNLDAKANSQIRLLWIACGTADSLIGVNRQFKEWLKSKDVKFSELEVPDIAHVWPLWRQNLTDLAPLLFQAKAK